MKQSASRDLLAGLLLFGGTVSFAAAGWDDPAAITKGEESFSPETVRSATGSKVRENRELIGKISWPTVPSPRRR